MPLTDTLWDALATLIKMSDKIVGLSGQVQVQQQKFEDLTARVMRLETALEIARAGRGIKAVEKK